MNFAVKEKICDVKNKKNETIFNCSINECNFHLARLIIEFGRNNNFNTINFKDSNCFRLFFKFPHNNVNDALIWSSREGHQEVDILLLTVSGIDVSAEDYKNTTALIWASENGHHEIVKLLLTVPGIDVNAEGFKNITALIWASSNGHQEVVKLLLTVPGIDVNAKNEDNITALILASLEGHHEVVKLLLTVPGIDVNGTKNSNDTRKYAHETFLHNVRLTVMF